MGLHRHRIYLHCCCNRGGVQYFYGAAMNPVFNALETFQDWIDNRAVIRRIILFFTLFMTYYGVNTAWKFASASPFDGIGTAAVIAAVLAPIAALQGAAFQNY